MTWPVVQACDPGAISGLVLTEFPEGGPRLRIKAQVGRRKPARCASIVEVRDCLKQIADLAPKAGITSDPRTWYFATEAWFVGPNPATLTYTLRGFFLYEAAVDELFGRPVTLLHAAQWKSRWLGTPYALLGGADLHKVAVARVEREQGAKVSSDIACAYGVSYALGTQLGWAPSRTRTRKPESP